MRWRLGGGRNGRWQSITVRSRERAKTVHALLEANADALRADDQRIVAIVTGVATPPPGVLTFGEVANRYIATRTTAKASTRDNYAGILARNLAEWHAAPIADITPDQVAMLVNRLRDRGLNPASTMDFAIPIERNTSAP